MAEDEQTRQELREQAEKGRKAQAVLEFLDEFLAIQRANTLNMLETFGFAKPEEMWVPVIYLRVLRAFENQCRSLKDIGDIAERELNENGSE